MKEATKWLIQARPQDPKQEHCQLLNLNLKAEARPNGSVWYLGVASCVRPPETNMREQELKNRGFGLREFV